MILFLICYIDEINLNFKNANIMNKLIEDKSDDMSKKDQNLTNYYSRRDFVNLLGF